MRQLMLIISSILVVACSSGGGSSGVSTSPSSGGGDSSSNTISKIVIIDPADATVGDNVTVSIQAQNSSDQIVTTYSGSINLNTTGSATGGGLVTITSGVGSITISNNVLKR